MTLSPLEANLAAALGIRKLRIWGGDGEGNGGGNGGNGAEGGNGGAGSGTGNAGSDGNGGDGADDTQRRIDEAEQKAKDAEAARKDADKQLKDIQKQLKDKELEGKDESERTAAERDDYKEKYEKLLKIVETSFIDQSIANISGVKDKQGNPKYDWHNASALRPFLDMDKLDLDIDTGEVKGLESQLSDIAKNHTYLLVSKADRDGGNGGNGGNGGTYTPPDGRGTGNHPYGGQPRQRETDRNKLGSKYRLPGFSKV